MSFSPLVSTWICDAGRAKVALPSFAAELDLARPWLGLHHAVANDVALDSASLLRIESQPGTETESITDQYIRGDDLVVNYSQTQLRPVAVHVYWRAFANENLSRGVDLIVSMQTELLDSDPTLRIVSDLPEGELVASDAKPASVLFRPVDSLCTLLLAAHPSDCEEIEQADSGNGDQITFSIFRPGLEKGVIRRARLRAAILPRDNDQQLAAACHAEFISAAPPLTT